MPIPDYQTVMLPLLGLNADGNVHSTAEAAEFIAQKFNLTEPEKSELLPSGGALKLFSRVGWARTYLAKAGLLESVGRGKFRITERGLALLKTKPVKIDVALLNQYPEFIGFRERGTPSKSSTLNGSENDPIAAQQTPQEQLETSYQALRHQIADDLLERLSKVSPRFFEKLVVDLLVAMGYGGSRSDAGQAIGKTGDDGIDGIVKEDRLGLDAVYVQAKRWKGTVGRPDVQSFAGSLEGHRARRGVFITTSQFSSEAKDYVNELRRRLSS